jgi:hypothetical protein
MQVIKCDKCGCYVEGGEFNILNVENTHNESNYTYHLCPDCRCELDKFLEDNYQHRDSKYFKG